VDEGRFSISADVTYQRVGAWQRDRTGDRPATVYCVRAPEVPRNLPKRLAIFRFKTGALQTLLACPASGLFLSIVGAIG
jgi:hypothetical protein